MPGKRTCLLGARCRVWQSRRPSRLWRAIGSRRRCRPSPTGSFRFRLRTPWSAMHFRCLARGPIYSIPRSELVAVVRAAQADGKVEMGHRVASRISAVFDFAQDTGLLQQHGAAGLTRVHIARKTKKPVASIPAEEKRPASSCGPLMATKTRWLDSACSYWPTRSCGWASCATCSGGVAGKGRGVGGARGAYEDAHSTCRTFVDTSPGNLRCCER